MTDPLRRLYHRLVPVDHRRDIYRLVHRTAFRRLRTAVFEHPPRGTFSLRRCDDLRAIFIHVPKAAGTSVAISIFGDLIFHYTAADYRTIYGRRTYDDYFVFTLVRNPWDRLHSAYKFLRKGGWSRKDQAFGERHVAPHATFGDFVRTELRKPEVLQYVHFRAQHEFVCDRRGRLLVDHLGYFETLQEDYGAICRRLGVTAPLGHTNSSGDAGEAGGYRAVYDDETRAIVAHVYARDIALFGYTFEGIGSRVTGGR